MTTPLPTGFRAAEPDSSPTTGAAMPVNGGLALGAEPPTKAAVSRDVGPTR